MFRLAPWVLASLAICAGCGKSEPAALRVTEIEALGVQVELPDGWG
jgi:hypothetical protein